MLSGKRRKPKITNGLQGSLVTLGRQHSGMWKRGTFPHDLRFVNGGHLKHQSGRQLVAAGFDGGLHRSMVSAFFSLSFILSYRRSSDIDRRKNNRLNQITTLVCLQQEICRPMVTGLKNLEPQNEPRRYTKCG